MVKVFIFTLPYNFYHQSLWQYKTDTFKEGKSGVITVIPHPLKYLSHLCNFYHQELHQEGETFKKLYRMENWNSIGFNSII